MFKSKRFWAAIAAIATTIGLMVSHEVTMIAGFTAIIGTIFVLIGADTFRKLGG